MDIGELEISGAGIFKRYWNKPQETAESSRPTAGSRPATRSRSINSVTIKLSMRIKAIICLSSGKNVAPAKIEALFATSPYIEQVFTIGDERAVISTLLVPSLTFFKDKFDREGIEYDGSQVLIDTSAGAPIVVKSVLILSRRATSGDSLRRKSPGQQRA